LNFLAHDLWTIFFLAVMTSTTLRAVTHRLTTTPVDQLPSIASFLATSLSDCAALLSAPQAQKGKSESDNAVQIHKLKTRLVSLLQDRTIEGRWTAVVLVKATVEAGQWEILRGYEPIVRGLISILAKPDPISTRKMCVITLTRIFHLTYQYPTLVREITTPQLPGFITAALNLVSVITKTSSGSTRKPKPNTPFMEIVLCALLELIPRHPTIFRPFSSQLRTLLAEVVGFSSPAYFPEHVTDVAEQLLVSLHKCAPKDKAGSGWNDDCRSTILSIHRTTDQIYRAVVEQWESVDVTLKPTRSNCSQEVCDKSPDGLGLPGWTGLHSGVDRLIVLLKILSGFVSSPSAAAVAIPLGSILDLTSRLTSVTVPLNGESQTGIQFNQEIGREERESLWMELPRIHIACMGLLSSVMSVLETSATSVIQTILEQAVWTFRGETFSKDVRSAVYALLRSLVPLNGPAMSKQSVASLASVVRSCCHDLLPPTGDSTANSGSDPKAKSKGSQGTTANADAFLNPELQKSRQTQSVSPFLDLHQNASGLLQAFLVSVPAELVPPSTRAEIDRTIILTSDKDAMLASVLNPVPAIKGRGAGSSIIPFLVRTYGEQMEVEALVRPRMPVLMTAPELDAYVDEDQEEDEEMADDVYTAPPTSDFMKQPVSIPLQAPKVEQPKAADPLPAFHKRTFTEESTAQGQASQKQDTKKARFEEVTSASHSAPVITQAEAPRVSVQVTTTTTSKNNPAAASQQAAGADDESDDELPTLNMDSDTDEEDDDVTMEG
jgi:pre-rRNA-processing protein RIX1